MEGVLRGLYLNALMTDAADLSSIISFLHRVERLRARYGDTAA